ncbi:MAG: metallophosphoesterase [Cyanobacteria bacterium]|nr:metallophosphoesterase [Cyanobacteriota bacterium]MDA0866028.1 metallophosphoesterase [Cyanobacteriota bacterium]
MGKRGFFALLITSWVLCIGVACLRSPQLLSQPTPVAPNASPKAVAVAPRPEFEGLYDPPRGDVRLVVISDLNSAYGSTDYDPEVDQAIDLIPFWQPDLVVCSGDMVAGQRATLTPAQIQAMWAAFDDHVAAPLRQAQIPFGFTIGNHDASSAWRDNRFVFQRERDLAAAYWQDPTHDPGVDFVDRDDFPFYYSFQQGDVFVVVWDGSSSRIPADKLAWVEQTLASPAAQQAKIRIVLGHLPLYGVAVGRDKPGEVMNNAGELRALLEQYDVHTYISGHQHAYYPAHRGDLQLLHTGIVGSGPRALIDSDLPRRKTLTVIDIAFDDPDLTTYTTYDMATLAPVDDGQLPRLLVGHNGMVLRRDLAWQDLTAAELEFCKQRLGEAQCGPG